MADEAPARRRVVTGNDEQGRSHVMWDGPAPNAIGAPPRPGYLDLWVFHESPAPLSEERDDGNLPWVFEPPDQGGHFRIVNSSAPPPGAGTPTEHAPRLRPGTNNTWDRGGLIMHKTRTVDYAIALDGERRLILDDGQHSMESGDVVIQLGNWHGWASSSGGHMAFIMMGARWSEPWPK